MSEKSNEFILNALKAVMQNGMVNLIDDTYRFSHDRIFEASYSLIPNEEKMRLHYLMGNLALRNRSKDEITDDIFYIVNQINQQWPLVDKRFGKPIDKEFIKEKRIGKSFIRFYYLHKFENHSMYWQYDFYKPHNEWKINKIIFLDSLESLYE